MRDMGVIDVCIAVKGAVRILFYIVRCPSAGRCLLWFESHSPSHFSIKRFSKESVLYRAGSPADRIVPQYGSYARGRLSPVGGSSGRQL
jgi:hypothetical protein